MTLKGRRIWVMVLIVVALAVLIGFKPLGAQQIPQGSEAIPLPAGEKPSAAGKDPGPPPAAVEEVHTELRLIPYPKIQKPDSTLQKGVIKVVQQGRQGRERVTYRVKKVDGRPVERTDIGREVLSQPKSHIELIGTGAKIAERVLMEIRPIPFQMERKPDETLPKGTIKVLQQGREGEEKFTYRVIVTDGKETERIILGDEILTPPINQIEAVGTGPEVVPDKQ